MDRSVRWAWLLLWISIIPLTAGCGGSGAASAKLQGTVLDDATLEPIAGAGISIGASRARTDDDGRFSIATGEGGRLLAIDAGGYEEKLVNVEIAPGVNDTGNLYLLPLLEGGKGGVRGRVLDLFGVAVAAATISCGNQAATSRGDGSFALYNIPAGTQTILALRDQDAGWANTVVVPGEFSSHVIINLGAAPPEPPAKFDLRRE